MQITINTDDILGDETTIREEVIHQVSNALLVHLRKEASAALTSVIESGAKAAVEEFLRAATTESIDTPFTEVDAYGRPGKTASVRDRIVDHLKVQCVIKNTPYDSDQTVFGKVVKGVVESEMAKFKKEFDSLVTQKFVADATDYAAAKLKASIGIA